MNFFFNENCKNAVYIHDFIQNMSTAYRLPTKSVPGLLDQTLFEREESYVNRPKPIGYRRSLVWPNFVRKRRVLCKPPYTFYSLSAVCLAKLCSKEKGLT